MKTLKTLKTLKTVSILIIIFLSISCSKDDDSSSNALQSNTLSFKGSQIKFNSLIVDDAAPNNTSEYALSSLNDLSMVFYCKYLGTGVQDATVATVTYTADGINYYPVNNYPMLTVRGFINHSGVLYDFTSGQIKIKRTANGDQTIEISNLKLKAGADEQTLNGTINLPKS